MTAECGSHILRCYFFRWHKHSVCREKTWTHGQGVICGPSSWYPNLDRLSALHRKFISQCASQTKWNEEGLNLHTEVPGTVQFWTAKPVLALSRVRIHSLVLDCKAPYTPSARSPHESSDKPCLYSRKLSPLKAECEAITCMPIRPAESQLLSGCYQIKI